MALRVAHGVLVAVPACLDDVPTGTVADGGEDGVGVAVVAADVVAAAVPPTTDDRSVPPAVPVVVVARCGGGCCRCSRQISAAMLHQWDNDSLLAEDTSSNGDGAGRTVDDAVDNIDAPSPATIGSCCSPRTCC